MFDCKDPAFLAREHEAGNYQGPSKDAFDALCGIMHRVGIEPGSERWNEEVAKFKEEENEFDDAT